MVESGLPSRSITIGRTRKPDHRGHRLHERTVYESDVAGVWSKRMLYP